MLTFAEWKEGQVIRDKVLGRKRTRFWYYGAYGQYKATLRGEPK